MIQARAAWKQMELNPTQEAAASYNLAASRLFDQLHCGQTDWYRKASVMELRPTGLLIWMDQKAKKLCHLATVSPDIQIRFRKSSEFSGSTVKSSRFSPLNP